MDSELIVEVVDKLFPPGAEIHPGSDGDPPESRFWIIPGKGGEPRWILPHRSSGAYPYLRHWRPDNLPSRLKWLCLMSAYRSGRLGWISGVAPLRIVTPECTDWSHLGWPSTSPPVPVLYIGTPGPTRKVVAGLIDSHARRVVSVAKAPLGPGAGPAIIHEADILERLTEQKPGIAPRLLFVDKQTGIATQDVIEGGTSARNLTPAHIDWLVGLAVPGESLSLGEYARKLAERITARVDADDPAGDVLAGITSGIDADSALPAVWVHGDFAPWNLKLRQDGALAAVDWEAAYPGGLPLFDLVYFGSIQAFLFGRKQIIPASMKPLLGGYLDRLGIDPAVLRTLVSICLAEDWLRCHEAGDVERAAFLIRHLRAETGGTA